MKVEERDQALCETYSYRSIWLFQWIYPVLQKKGRTAPDLVMARLEPLRAVKAESHLEKTGIICHTLLFAI